MRVISGIYKRRRFDVPHSFKARPTTDFAKENLFNVLSNYMDFEDGIRALDLFAGTGSIKHRACVQRLRPSNQRGKRPRPLCLHLQNYAGIKDGQVPTHTR